MKTNLKIKGFTILELMVSLIISSIVILTAYSFISNMKGYFNHNLAINSKLGKSLLFQSAFLNDIQNADKIWCKSNNVVLEKSGDSIHYVINDSMVIREKSGMKAYFKLDSVAMRFSLLGSIIQPSSKFELVDDISLKEKISHSITFTYHKLYTAKDLLNLKP